MRDHAGALSFKPRLPPDLARLAFGLSFRGRRLRVEVDQEQATYSLGAGKALDVTHHTEQITVTPSTPVTRPIPPLERRQAARQPRGRAPARRHRQPGGASATTPVR
jgi:alpha,alpha-trehalose phosphorylase